MIISADEVKCLAAVFQMLFTVFDDNSDSCSKFCFRFSDVDCRGFALKAFRLTAV